MQTNSPPTAHCDEEVTLLDQIKWVTFGHPVDDVLQVSMALVMQCVIQRTPNKATALRALDAVYLRIADEIDIDYENMKPLLKGELHGQPS